MLPTVSEEFGREPDKYRVEKHCTMFYEHRPREIRGAKEVIAGRERDILLANAEAHRFAIGYHRKTSRKDLTA